MSDFITKDSGERQNFESGMVRDTQQGKPRFDLLMPKDVPYSDQLLTRFAELMARGAEKYGDRNWEKADSQEELDRAKASALRHMIQWFAGEVDEDHAAAVMFNLTMAEYVKGKITSRREKLQESINEVGTKILDEVFDNLPPSVPVQCPVCEGPVMAGISGVTRFCPEQHGRWKPPATKNGIWLWDPANPVTSYPWRRKSEAGEPPTKQQKAFEAYQAKPEESN